MKLLERLRNGWARMRRPVALDREPVAGGDREAGAGPDAQKSYSSDQPIRSSAEDRFNRFPFAQRIADTIARRSDAASLVVGLYGPWGDGKTSVLSLMDEALKAHPDVVVVRFNPWNFGSEQQLLRGFFDTLADGLGRSLASRKEELGRVLGKYGRILSIASVSIGGAVQISPGDAAAGLGEALSAVELDELRARLERILRQERKRVVVLIDDIDRLDREEIHALFKLVKLSASFEYTSYVLAFDDDMVAAALGQKYGAGGSESGRSFLEKIVQVPLHLPPAEQVELRALAFDGVNAAIAQSGVELTSAHVEAFVRYFVDALEPQMGTPRQAKRFANALSFALPLLKGEVHPVDLMLIEGVRVLYPRLYAVVRDNPQLFLRAAEDAGRAEERQRRTRDLVERALEDAGVVNTDRVWRRLIEILFPRTGNASYGPEWNLIWAKEQRICSEEYFHRYFAYGVPPGDVGDIEISQLIRDAGRALGNAVAERLRAFARRRAMPRAITKLRMQEEEIELAAARVLAVTLAQNGKELPREQGLLVLGGTFAQAGILVSHLLRRIPGAEREALAVEVVRTAEPLAFAVECFRWMRPREREAPDSAKGTLSVPAEAVVGRALADRILAASQGAPLYAAAGEDAPGLYWTWKEFRGLEEVGAAIAGWLDAQDDAVDKFLEGFAGRAWGLESGLSQLADFDRSRYDNVAGVVDPDVVYKKLRERYGADIDRADYGEARDLPVARRIAHQFAAIHRAARTAGEAPTGDDTKAGGPVDLRS